MNDQPVVILTGAASGIGAALLQLLIEEHYRVVASDIIDFPKNKAYHIFKCDQSDPGQIDRLFDFTIEEFGHVDIFIANAGFAYFEKTEVADWKRSKRIYEVNTLAPIYAAHKMKELHKRQSFQMMITASAMSFWPLPGYAQYSSTKAALHSFAIAYRHELENGQHLQLVYPIGTRTAFFDRADSSPQPLLTQSAEQVAEAMLDGIKYKRKSIYPSLLFRLVLLANQILPILRPIVIAIEKRSYVQWLQSKH